MRYNFTKFYNYANALGENLILKWFFLFPE